MDNATALQKIQAALPHAVAASTEFRGQLSVTVPREALVELAQFLRDDSELAYTFLENLCGVDYLGRTPRFEVVYHLLSMRNRHRICLKVGLPEDDPTVPSLTPLWPTANWQEREAYDLFGFIFTDHPGLYRILMPDDWVGYPLRKDVPLGYEEVAFSINQDQIYERKPFAEE